MHCNREVSNENSNLQTAMVSPVEERLCPELRWRNKCLVTSLAYRMAVLGDHTVKILEDYLGSRAQREPENSKLKCVKGFD